MKIAVISPNPQHLQDIGRVLGAGTHQARLFDGGKSRMREVADLERPDLILVDGICHDPHELAHVEQLTAQHPDTAVVLLCSSHAPEFLLQAMRAGVREVLPSPVPAQALQAAVDRVAAKLKGHAPRRGKLLAFMACKGGSGATFLATNLGHHLGESSSVLLVDLNLQFGDALAFVHDGRPASTIADVGRDIARLDASLLAASTVKLSARYSLLPAPDDLSRAADVRPEHVGAILELALSQHDFVLVDLPRFLDPIAIAALDRAWRIYPVLQAALPDLRNATRLLQAFRSLGYPEDRCELIVNRFEKTSEIGLDEIQRSLGARRITTVPNAWREVHASITQGDPIANKARASSVTKQLEELARSLLPRAEESQRGLLGRLFRRA
jgi:pilus assembly protein CpaE